MSELIEKYLGEGTAGSLYPEIKKNPKQAKKVDQMLKKGWTIVMWDFDFVGMTTQDGKKFAEVYPDGKVKYPPKRDLSKG
jgi:hypothetical protein